jgi:hypothetical protein
MVIVRLKKTVKSGNEKQFDRAFKKAIEEGWIPVGEPQWRHSSYGAFKVAMFRK